MKKFLNWLLKDLISEIKDLIVEESVKRVSDKLENEIGPLKENLEEISNSIDKKIKKDIEDRISYLKEIGKSISDLANLPIDGTKRIGDKPSIDQKELIDLILKVHPLSEDRIKDNIIRWGDESIKTILLDIVDM